MVSKIRSDEFHTDIDYRYEDEKKIGLLRGNKIGAIRCVLTPSFRKPISFPPKNEPFSQEMHLKIQLLSRGLKLSNS
jgi:hypothetical protein